MPLVEQAPDDCGGLLALPFMDDEPGIGVGRGGTAMLIGLNADNATPGNAVKAALLATMFNLRLGSEVLDQQGFPRNQLVLSGGLTKTPQLAQVLANVFNVSVTLLESAEEGTACGAALLAKFRYEKINGSSNDWSQFVANQRNTSVKNFSPNANQVPIYESVYRRYKKLLATQLPLQNALQDDGTSN